MTDFHRLETSKLVTNKGQREREGWFVGGQWKSGYRCIMVKAAKKSH